LEAEREVKAKMGAKTEAKAAAACCVDAMNGASQR